MSAERTSACMRELQEALECGDRITSEASKILAECSQSLETYSQRTAPVRDRARTLTTASRNIRLAKEKCETLLTSLDMSRRLQNVIKQGPGYNMDAFLQAVNELEAANTVLWSNDQLDCVKEATAHSEQLWNDAMFACESDYALTLMNNSQTLTRDMLVKGVAEGHLELVKASGIPRLKVLSSAMLKGAHQRCIRVYTDLRNQSMEKMLEIMTSIPNAALAELQIMTLEQLEIKIKLWMDMVSALPLILREEKSVVKQVFPDSPNDVIFSQVVDVVLARVASYGRDILKTNHTSQKLFSLLDMHRTLEQVLNEMEGIIRGTDCQRRYDELKTLLNEIANSSTELFDSFQHSVKLDSNKKEVQDGTVHPLAAEVLTFFKRLFRHSNFMKVLYGNAAPTSESSQFQIGNHMSTTMARILMILQDNLETKARSFKSGALSDVFMMNNVNFIVTSVEQSRALELLGEKWVDRQKSIVQDYALEYHKITWEPLIKALNPNGEDITNQSNIQRKKSAIKDRFRTFNSSLEDIHQTQMEWIIPDPGLKKSVRDRILESLIPVYKLFWEKFKDSSFTKNVEKYLKYEVEEVERIIKEDLFENRIRLKEQRRLIL
eukprot:g4390.t1